MVEMAIYGVGIDLVRVDRLSKSFTRWGERFTMRVFTPAELEACAERKKQVGCLATRFAAKEAFVKALGRGMRSPVFWTDIEVQNNDLGKPEIFLSSRALEFCRDLGIRSWHLSLTDDGEYGAAVVILET
jgi:holo-[acyl-carrier protein] synthase